MSHDLTSYYHWLSVYTFIMLLHSEGYIEDATFEDMIGHMGSLKYLVDDEVEGEE